LGNKIVIISYYDYAGSGYRMAEAISLNSNNFVLPITLKPLAHPQGLKRLPAIAKMGTEGGFVYSEDIDRMQAIINDADIIHFKGDDLPSRKLFGGGVIIPDNIPIIVTVHGSMFRRSQSLKVSMPQSAIHDYVTESDFRTVGDPCLKYPEFEGVFTQVPFDFKGIEAKWMPSGNVITHSPSNRAKKGTQDLIEAVEQLQADGYDVELDIIEDVSYTESVKRKQESILFFDQSEAGYYGNSAIEAMAYGVPVACRMADEAYDWAEGKLDGCPVINTENDIASAISKYLDMPDSGKLDLSHLTRRYAHKVHSYEVVGKMWDKIYNDLLLQKCIV